METQITEAEKLLIYSNEPEIKRISSEAQTRANLLNELNDSGITNDQIKSICTSLIEIDDFIFREQLKVNKELKKQFDAGKKNLKDEYALPLTLGAIKFGLLSWFNYPPTTRGGKFENLIYTDRWKIDNEALEKFYIRYRLKIYVEGLQVDEYRELEKLCSILHFIKMPSNQVKDSSVLWNRVEPVGSEQYKPRWQWFIRER